MTKKVNEDLPTFSDPFYGNDIFKIRFRQLGDMSDKSAPDSPVIPQTDNLDKFGMGDKVIGKGIEDGETHKGEVIKIDVERENIEIEENGKIIALMPGTVKMQDDGQVGSRKQDAIEPTGTGQDDYTQAGDTFQPFSYESRYVGDFDSFLSENRIK